MNDDIRELGWLKKTYWGIVQGENFLGHFFLLIIRLYWGGLLINIGLKKLLDIGVVSPLFENLGIPYPLFFSYLVGTVELIGGLSLVLGLFSRILTLPLLVVFAVAYATAHKESIINFTPDLFFSQHPFLFLLTTLIVLCFGPGFFSIDYWLEKKTFGRPL